MPPPAKELIIKPEYSAVAAKVRNKPSRGVKTAISLLKKSAVSRVCEIGCGLLANTSHILKAFPYVILTDRREQFNRIEEKLAALSKRYRSFKEFIDGSEFAKRELQLHAAIVVNVLHILPAKEERIALLRAASRNLKENGILFIDGPYNEYYYRELVKTAVPYSDGYAMRRNGYCTFYKNIGFDEIRDYVEKSGFRVAHRVYLDHRITFTARKV